MIEVKNLSKSYDEVQALNDVSFSIAAGEVIGLLGPNGAGKTTLMKILTGFIHPSAGKALIKGYDILNQTRKVQQMIGYLPENAPLYPELTVQSYLKMIADLRKIPKDLKTGYIREAVNAVDLGDRLTRLISTLSKGYRQRVGLAQAILHKPKLLILDEPTNGLDPTQIIEVRHLIKKLACNSTVLVSTHILSEVEATCDRVIIMINGEVKTDSKLSDLSATANVYLTVNKNGKTNDIIRVLNDLNGVNDVCIANDAEERTMFLISGTTDRDLCPAIYQLAKNNDWPLCELRRDVRTLESVFNRLITEEGGI